MMDTFIRRQFRVREEPAGSGWLWVWFGDHSFGLPVEYQCELVDFEGRPSPSLRPHRRMWGVDLETGKTVA